MTQIYKNFIHYTKNYLNFFLYKIFIYICIMDTKRGTDIKNKINELGLKRKHVCRRVGVGETTLSLITNNKIRYVSNEMLDNIENYLNSCKT